MTSAQRLDWNRSLVVAEVASEIWKYLTPSVKAEPQQLLEAAALLQMPFEQLLTYARVHFLLSKEAALLVSGLPRLVRRLTTTTAHEEERSSERIRGAIRWSATISSRLASGNPIEYVTAPSRRAYQTPENELLVQVLDSILRLSRESGWNRYGHVTEAGVTIAGLIAEVQRWSAHRPLPDIDRRPITPRTVSRVRQGRHRRNYQAVLNAYLRYQEMVGRLDPVSIRSAVEAHALVVVRDPVLFELLTLFRVIEVLRVQGWVIEPLHVVTGSVRLRGTRADETLTLYYQAVPEALAGQANPYKAVQRHHNIANAKLLMPDLIIKHRRSDRSARWWLLECKMGTKRSAEASARVALRDLFAYRRAFAPTLDAGSDCAYGLGVVWGEGMRPRRGHEALLCTIDALEEAIEMMLQPSSPDRSHQERSDI